MGAFGFFDCVLPPKKFVWKNFSEVLTLIGTLHFELTCYLIISSNIGEGGLIAHSAMGACIRGQRVGHRAPTKNPKIGNFFILKISTPNLVSKGSSQDQGIPS